MPRAFGSILEISEQINIINQNNIVQSFMYNDYNDGLAEFDMVVVLVMDKVFSSLYSSV